MRMKLPAKLRARRVSAGTEPVRSGGRLTCSCPPSEDVLASPWLVTLAR